MWPTRPAGSPARARSGAEPARRSATAGGLAGGWPWRWWRLVCHPRSRCGRQASVRTRPGDAAPRLGSARGVLSWASPLRRGTRARQPDPPGTPLIVRYGRPAAVGQSVIGQTLAPFGRHRTRFGARRACATLAPLHLLRQSMQASNRHATCRYRGITNQHYCGLFLQSAVEAGDTRAAVSGLGEMMCEPERRAAYMNMSVREWFEQRSFHHQDFSSLSEPGHAGQRITTTLVLPTRNVAETIGPILARVALLNDGAGSSIRSCWSTRTQRMARATSPVLAAPRCTRRTNCSLPSARPRARAMPCGGACRWRAATS